MLLRSEMIRDHDKSEKKDIRVICLKPFHVDGAGSAALRIITAYCNETGPQSGLTGQFKLFYFFKRVFPALYDIK